MAAFDAHTFLSPSTRKLLKRLNCYPRTRGKKKGRRRHGPEKEYEARGLLILEPWISKILGRQKRWELRTRPTKIRGRIALIRSGSGLVVGTADLTNCIKLDEEMLRKNLHKHRVPIEDALRYLRSTRDRVLYAWVMTDARRYKKPRPYAHRGGAVIWHGLTKDYLRIAA